MAPSPFLRPFSSPSGEPKLTIVRGEGARVWDDRGRSYVDGLAALWYCQVGHGRAEIADAVARQLRTLAGFHCFDPYTNEPAERFAAALQARAPMPGARVFLTCSGSEAVRMRDGVAALAVRDAMIERGVLCRSLPGEVVAFCPPLVVGDGDLDELLDALGRSLPPA